MLESSHASNLDAMDKEILNVLQSNGRISNADLARQINLSPPATHARLKRLEKAGFIRDYAAHLDREQMGFDLVCFINISLQMHQHEEVVRFRQHVNQMVEVLECHHVTGEFDYLLKVVLRNRKDLERFVVEQLTPIPGVQRIYTSVVLTEIKSTTVLPIYV